MEEMVNQPTNFRETCEAEDFENSYSVGDTVVVKEFPHTTTPAFWVEKMNDYLGREMTISNVYVGSTSNGSDILYYNLEGSTYVWTAGCFYPLESHQDEVEMVSPSSEEIASFILE